MYREIRKQNSKLNDEDAVEIIKNGLYGILSTTDDKKCPYGVPLSYVYLDNYLYFHCDTEGHKLDNIRSNDNVSFCVIGEATVVPEKFTVSYESVIVLKPAHCFAAGFIFT